MAKNNGGSSKTFSSVMAFLLGFLFAIIVEVAAIFGFGYYAYTTPIENLFGLFKLQNSDSEGRQYVNTEEASTIKELVSVLSTKINEIGAQSIDDFETVFPALATALKTAYSTINQYADLDEEEFESTQFMNIVTYLQDVALNIRPSKLLTSMGNTSVTGDDANVIVKALLVGAEAEYVTIGETKYPVFCDTYTYSSEMGGYYRTSPVDGLDVYPFGTDYSYLYSAGTDNEDSQTQYNLYYIPCIIQDGAISPATVAEGFNGFKYSDDDKDWVRTEKNDKNEDVNINIFEENENLVYVAVKRGEDGTFTLDADALRSNPTSCVYQTGYGENFIKLTGTYFKTNDGTEIQVFPVTLNSLMGSTYAPLYYVSIVDAIKSDSGENKVVSEMFSGNNLGELLDGKIDFDKKIQDMTLSTVVESIKPDNGTMMSIVYNVKNVTSTTTTTTNEDGSATETTVWTGTYKYTENGVAKTKPVTIILDEEGYVEKVVDENDEEVEGNKVSQIASTAETLEVTDTMKFKPTDAIMTYIGYGITKVRESVGTTADGSEYTFVGKADITVENNDGTTSTQTVDCYIAVNNDGYISECWYMTADDDGNSTVRNDISGATTSEITDRVNKINEKLTLPDIITVNADENIMLYVSYGITGVTAVSGEAYQYTGVYSVTETSGDGTTTTHTYTCYIYTKSTDDGAGNVTYGKEIDKVMYDSNDDGTLDEYLYGTIINDISGRVSTLTSDMTIGEVMNTSGSTILTALKDTKINDIGTAIPNLKISEVLSEEDISKSSILSQLKDSTINSLSTDINSMSVQAIYAADIYGYKVASSYDENITYYSYDNTNYTEVKAGIVTADNYSTYYVLMQSTTTYTAGYVYYTFDETAGKFVLAQSAEDGSTQNGKLVENDFNGTTTYYTYGSPTGMWKLLLCSTEYQQVTGSYDAGTTYYTYDETNMTYTKATGITEFASGTTYYTAYKDETVYYIENMNKMINSSTTSIYNSTLSELKEAGVIGDNVNETDLDKTLTWTENGTEKSMKLKDMSFSDLMKAVIAIAGVQSSSSGG